HVAAPLVGRERAVGEQKARRSQVIGDDPERDVTALVLARGRSGERRRALDDRAGEGGLVDAPDPLQDERHALEAPGRIARWGRPTRSRHRPYASSSSRNTVACRRSPGSPKRSVTSSQAKRMASFLK